MTTPYDDPLYRDPELAQFYDMDNEWRADFDMYLTRAVTAGRILDLGCGTGTLIAAIAEKYPDKILTAAIRLLRSGGNGLRNGAGKCSAVINSAM